MNSIVRRTSWILCTLAGLALVGCQTTAVNTAQQRYMGVWNNQLDYYRNQFVQKSEMIRAEDKNWAKTNPVGKEDYWNQLVSKVFEISLQVRDAFEVAGRGEAMKAFLAHMQTSPTPGLSDVWFLQQGEQLKRDIADVDSQTKVFFKNFEEKLRKDANWIPEVEILARQQGTVMGRASELQSLQKQALSYYIDRQVAQNEDRYQAQRQAQAAQLLLNAATYLAEVNYQQQLVNALNRPRTCVNQGATVTCY